MTKEAFSVEPSTNASGSLLASMWCRARRCNSTRRSERPPLICATGSPRTTLGIATRRRSFGHRTNLWRSPPVGAATSSVTWRETTFVATSNGLRRRYTQPTGSVEINAKRDGASAWAGVSTPDFVDVPIDSLLEQPSTRLSWAKQTVELPAGRYETIMPPTTVAHMMIYLTWQMSGRGAQEGRTALSAPGGATRVGEKLTELRHRIITVAEAG